METYDFVIVGSGAGGAPLAANLVEAGFEVLVLEAGGDDVPPVYSVPAFHALASEDPDLTWRMYVDLYDDPAQAARNTKAATGLGVLYPRAGTLGGCTAHHAMITLVPHDSDWDAIARLTGDRSWSSSKMRSYFERLERCAYRRRPKALPRNPLLARLLASLPFVSDAYVNRGRHGFDGWLETRLSDPKLLLPDSQLVSIVLGAAESTLHSFLHRRLRKWEPYESLTDPNDWRVARSRSGGEGLWSIPTAVSAQGRSGARERLLAARAAHPDRLHLRTQSLACRVLLDDEGAAYGVEYLNRRKAYRASDPPDGEPELGTLETVIARHEVIVSAGAFNTPQLLKLSGIGPREELIRHGIECRVDLPGVGRNLQDRYEVTVVSEAHEDFALLKGAAFKPWSEGDEPDPQWTEWLEGRGVYATNGALVGIVHRSRPELKDPDLFIFGLPADFRGYAPGYSTMLEQSRRRFTWAILKGHTGNTGGTVLLRSTDPRDPPQIRFRYFDEAVDDGVPGSQGDIAHDLDDVVCGVELVRDLNRRAWVISDELHPGPAVATKEEVRSFVANEAWGHHACGTARIGKGAEPMAVVDSELRVHGVPRLRVVDASVFPRIPGFFIVTPTYMVSEKASDLVITAARGRPTDLTARTHAKQRESA